MLVFEKPDRICITDDEQGGAIVRLNDKDRTELRFDASERLKARKILDELNNYHTNKGKHRFRLVPLIGEATLGGDR